MCGVKYKFFRNKTLLFFCWFTVSHCYNFIAVHLIHETYAAFGPFGTSQWYYKHNTKLYAHIYVTLLTGILTWSSTSKQDVDIPKQKHGIQPSVLLADRAKVPGLHSLHCSPNTFSWRKEKKSTAVHSCYFTSNIFNFNYTAMLF